MTTTRKYNIHRGELLNEVAQKHDLSIIKITKRAKFSRTAFYAHVKKPDLSFEILQRYGKVLNYNFAKDIPEFQQYIVEEPEEVYHDAGEITTFEEAIKDRNYWRDQFNELAAKVLKKLDNF